MPEVLYRKPLTLLVLVALLSSCLSPSGVHAQTTSDSAQSVSTEFPLWAKDLRRGEIVAFGSLPFTVLLASLGVDVYRSASHGWDSNYAPWGGIGKTKDDLLLTLGVAAGASILVSVIDFLIVRHRRVERERNTPPPGTPIIIRKPWPEESEAGSAPEGADEVR
jgi:hypothetical protein